MHEPQISGTFDVGFTDTIATNVEAWYTVNRTREENDTRNHVEVTRQFCHRNVKKVSSNLPCKWYVRIFWLLQNYSQLCKHHCLLYTTRFSVYKLRILPTPYSVFYMILGINSSYFHMQYSLIIPSGITLYCLQSTKLIFVYNIDKPIPVTARSKAWVCSHSLAGNAGSNPTGGMDAWVLWVLFFGGRFLSLGLITRPEEAYRVWSVWV